MLITCVVNALKLIVKKEHEKNPRTEENSVFIIKLVLMDNVFCIGLSKFQFKVILKEAWNFVQSNLSLYIFSYIEGWNRTAAIDFCLKILITCNNNKSTYVLSVTVTCKATQCLSYWTESLNAA